MVGGQSWKWPILVHYFIQDGHFSKTKNQVGFDFINIEFCKVCLPLDLPKVNKLNLKLFFNSTDSTSGPISPIINIQSGQLRCRLLEQEPKYNWSSFEMDSEFPSK